LIILRLFKLSGVPAFSTQVKNFLYRCDHFFGRFHRKQLFRFQTALERLLNIKIQQDDRSAIPPPITLTIN